MPIFIRKLALYSTLFLMILASTAPAAIAGEIEEERNGGEMVADALVARPIGLVITGLGIATFVVSLPFSWLGGNVDEAAEKLVKGPARATFDRCLGCRQTNPAP